VDTDSSPLNRGEVGRGAVGEVGRGAVGEVGRGAKEIEQPTLWITH
jgi:hypothetical protein